MKKLLLTFAIVALSLVGFGQTYVSPSVSFYNGTGSFSQRTQATVEVGRTWDAFSLGLAGGVLDLTKQAKAYAEARATFTAFQKGKVSLSGTLGAGRIFDSPENFLTELGVTGGVAINKNVGVNLSAGKYFFNGTNSASQASYIGVGLQFSLND